jgi:predicted dehydrogenase
MKVGIAGFGGAGQAQFRHFSVLGCEVVAVFDPEPSAHQRAKNLSPSIFTTADFDAFLASGIDSVAICSPDKTHADFFVRSLRAGKHVICEKPLADSMEGCRQILAAARDAPNCVAAVQHQMRFLPVHLAMNDLVSRGELGRIAYIEGYYIHNLTERAYLYDLWRFEDNATPLVYSGCHFVDLLRWLLNDEVVEVTGMANNIAFPEYPESDTNVILMRFRSGVVGKVVCAFGFGRPQDHSVRIYGNEKCVENNLLFSKDGSFTVFARPEWPALLSIIAPAGSADQPRAKVASSLQKRDFGRLFRAVLGRGRFWMSAVKTMLLSRVLERLVKTKHLVQDYTVSSYPLRLYEHNLAVRNSITDFVDAIKDGRQPKCGVIDAARTVAVCLAGVEAYRTGTSVSLEKYWLPEFGEFSPRAATHRRPATVSDHGAA